MPLTFVVCNEEREYVEGVGERNSETRYVWTFGGYLVFYVFKMFHV